MAEKEGKKVCCVQGTETGAVQGWAMVDSRCQLHSFNQAINGRFVTPNNMDTKKHYRIGSYEQQIVFLELSQDRELY